MIGGWSKHKDDYDQHLFKDGKSLCGKFETPENTEFSMVKGLFCVCTLCSKIYNEKIFQTIDFLRDKKLQSISPKSLIQIEIKQHFGLFILSYLRHQEFLKCNDENLTLDSIFTIIQLPPKGWWH